MRTPSRSTSAASATPRAKARATSLTFSARRSLAFGERSLESRKGYSPGGRTTAPTTMGPAQAPSPPRPDRPRGGLFAKRELPRALRPWGHLIRLGHAPAPPALPRPPGRGPRPGLLGGDPLGPGPRPPEGGAIAFYGLPYAEAERFRAPKPLKAWPPGVGQEAVACPQAPGITAWFGGPIPLEREDCLVLNVYLPAQIPPPGASPSWSTSTAGASPRGQGPSPSTGGTGFRRRGSLWSPPTTAWGPWASSPFLPSPRRTRKRWGTTGFWTSSRPSAS